MGNPTQDLTSGFILSPSVEIVKEKGVGPATPLAKLTKHHSLWYKFTSAVYGF
jgi:hypothetical protein